MVEGILYVGEKLAYDSNKNRSGGKFPATSDDVEVVNT
jgi:hypothetical protein